MPTDANRIAAAIAEVVANGRNDGNSGNCARFAIALNRALDGAGEYHIVDGEHPEYADHVILKVGEAYFDCSGLSTAEEVEQEWGGDLEYFGAEGDETSVLRLADDSGASSSPLDMDRLEEEFRSALGTLAAPGPEGHSPR